jgi:hypothetical protein
MQSREAAGSYAKGGWRTLLLAIHVTVANVALGLFKPSLSRRRHSQQVPA